MRAIHRHSEKCQRPGAVLEHADGISGPTGRRARSLQPGHPRLVPGVYTVRLTKNGKATETKLTIGLDRRAKFSEADRKAQFDAAMKVRALFEEESALMDRILFLRDALTKTGGALAESDPLKKSVGDLDGCNGLDRPRVARLSHVGGFSCHGAGRRGPGPA